MINLGIVLFIAATLNFKLCFSACARAEYEVNGECCPMCAPGNYVYWHCTVDTSTTCVPCPGSTYTDELNGLHKCLPCSLCDSELGLRIKKTCTRSADTVCEPLEGSYCTERMKDSCRLAVKHSECQPGQYVKQKGINYYSVPIPESDGQCEPTSPDSVTLLIFNTSSSVHQSAACSVSSGDMQCVT
ncbi:tumor necrosis factor receptor superfamily member 14 [Labeo rohita]|uniref:tumor necrosis factor receptor superfamily member 14 n=1 Tax=Labeo rohita TaxID=84645 RepID=UPI0021E1E287|nr:tumor necrosis factor receptor superfamily member 14 [Labeo rohita]